MNEPTKAVEKPKAVKTIQDLLQGDQFKKQVTAALPKHLPPDRFIRVACTAVMRTPQLAECDQISFFNALLKLSQFGLEPDGYRAHLIPFRNTKRNCMEVQLIIDYKGLNELAVRSGLVSFLHAEIICVNDIFSYNKGEIKTHEINFREDRGEMFAAYAFARFKDGSEKCDVMSLDEILAIRERSQSKDKGPWVTDFREMAKKTVLRKLSKLLVLSNEFRDAVEVDDEDIAGRKPVIDIDAPMFSKQQISESATPVDEPKPFIMTTFPVIEKKVEPDKTSNNPLSPQEQVCHIVIGDGYTFDQWKAWAVGSGFMPEADSMGSFEDIPHLKAKKLIEAKASMLKGLAGMKEAK